MGAGEEWEWTPLPLRPDDSDKLSPSPESEQHKSKGSALNFELLDPLLSAGDGVVVDDDVMT